MSKEDSRLEVIDRLVDYVIQRLPAEDSPLIRAFIRQYYLSVSPEDLSARSIHELYGAVISHWNFLYQRMPGELKVRVFNPQLEEHGWQSTHTIIEISYDDMPFIVDSVNMSLVRHNFNIHMIVHLGSLKFRRGSDGKILEVFDQGKELPDVKSEAVVYIEIDRQSDISVLENITKMIIKVLTDVRTVVEDWPKMREKALEILREIEVSPKKDPDQTNEYIDFLRWLTEDHFTFLGYQEYSIFETEEQMHDSELLPEFDLGLFKIKRESAEQYTLSEFPQAAQKVVLSKEQFLLGKTNIRSTVHRPAYTDFVAIKKLDQQGKVIGVRLFIGLYTAVAYNSSPKQIPLLRRKVELVLKQAGFPPRSHDDRALLNILETLPRDDLFQASERELLKLSTGILHLQERQKIRLFMRKDVFGFFITCLVFVPREKFNVALSERIKGILQRGLKGLSVEVGTRFSESILARIHYVVRVNPKKESHYDEKLLEQKLIDAGRTWQDDLKDALVDHCGEEKGNELLRRYKQAFPVSYQEAFPAEIAVIDIDYFERLSVDNPLEMSLYRPLEETAGIIRFKLFRMNETIPLSDVVPILENMGLKIISERPYEITPKNNNHHSIWINDYRMLHQKDESFETESIKEIFQEAFDRIWKGYAENDGFNHLVLGAKLTWREIMVLRAYAKYLWQAGFSFSQEHVEETLTANAEISALLVQLFKLRFDPEHQATDEEQKTIKEAIEKLLESVTNLNEDRILRRFLHTIFATIRTNYYIKTDEHYRPYFSIKLQSKEVPELPLPVPLYEIFVYSPRVEAIHLRAAKVARGGIRWSDRREDFRTEILSLMKTQQVKNAVIVPMGAKGGFVVKRMPQEGTREQQTDEVVFCYETLIRGLLDLTDNYKGTEIIPPAQVVRYDRDDPYLVVAADKGTATFSNIANAISKEYGFWLGDAFASGGSTGYDHKKMGITAKGAWECVKEHFLEINLNSQKEDFTVIGIGDMAGDVFGNGMLLSKHIKLIAAFNNLHIFIDPNPDPETSFFERQRLFDLPRSSWADYNPALISAGGGVYLRAAKWISLSPDAQAALDFYQDKVEPNDLIKAILKAPVVLFWNGGIGTYVKSSRESNLEVGDRLNDQVRVNGKELRAKVVGEGGNLGFTQLGRVEYALNGGYLNTDAIDNSGGVNCSDNEVNIKILLNIVVERGELTEKQRNETLAKLQDEVAELVLRNNRRQARAISMTGLQAANSVEMYGRLIQELVRAGKLDRALEYLPDKEELLNRKQINLGLTRPEIAVLMAYTKTSLKESLLASDLPEDNYYIRELERAFPKPLQKHFKQFMPHHRLKREIIATQLSNAIINEMDITFVSRLQDETGCPVPDIVRSYTVSRQIFKAEIIYHLIHQLGITVETAVQYKMIHEVNRLIRRGARWILKNRREGISIPDLIEYFMRNIEELSDALPLLLAKTDTEIEEMSKNLMEAHVPPDLAWVISGIPAMFSAMDIVEAATIYKFSLADVAYVFYEVGNRMQLGWFRTLIKSHSVNNHWEALARAAFRDDLDRQQRNLAVSILRSGAKLSDKTLDKLGDPQAGGPKALVDYWFKRHKAMIERWAYFISELKNTPEADFTMFAVALRELLDMAQTSTHKPPKNVPISNDK